MAEREESTFTLRYKTKVSINASAKAIWAKLTDAAGFPRWNTTVQSIEGNIAPGGKLVIRVPTAPGRKFTPKVVEFAPDQRMVWRDGFFPMFRGTRTFALKPSGTGTEFEMEEVFQGLMLPMIKGQLPDFRPVFDQYAADLKKVCEAG
jgi:hypothetical protein